MEHKQSFCSYLKLILEYSFSHGLLLGWVGLPYIKYVVGNMSNRAFEDSIDRVGFNLQSTTDLYGRQTFQTKVDIEYRHLKGLIMSKIVVNKYYPL